MEQFIKNLARGAGAILRDGFRTKFKIGYKNNNTWDLVTEYDLASEKYLIDRILKKYPTHGILSEESGHIIKNHNFWVLDPLDGTSSFSRGLTGFCVSIAFVSNNKIVLSAVYDPIEDELFFAKAKKGATLNGKKILIPNADDLNFSGISLQVASGRTDAKDRRKVYNMVTKYQLWPLNTGSAALSSSYVACGRYHCVVSKLLSPWDYCGSALILKEAGAKVTDFEGKPFRWNSDGMISASPALHKQIMVALKS